MSRAKNIFNKIKGVLFGVEDLTPPNGILCQGAVGRLVQMYKKLMFSCDRGNSSANFWGFDLCALMLLPFFLRSWPFSPFVRLVPILWPIWRILVRILVERRSIKTTLRLLRAFSIRASSALRIARAAGGVTGCP